MLIDSSEAVLERRVLRWLLKTAIEETVVSVTSGGRPFQSSGATKQKALCDIAVQKPFKFKSMIDWLIEACKVKS